MGIRTILLIVVASHYASAHGANTSKLIFDGFSEADLKLTGEACVTGHAIRLTQGIYGAEGDAFYHKPLNFSSRSDSNGGGATFSTTFVFAITSDATEDPSRDFSMTFVLSSTLELYHPQNNSSGTGLPWVVRKDYNSSDQFFTIDLSWFDRDNVEIDVQSFVSVHSRTKSFYTSNSRFHGTELSSDKPMQVWVDYDSRERKLNITLEEFVQFQMSRPQRPPQFSSSLSSLLSNSDLAYAGFSSTGQINGNLYVLGWSFIVNGEAPSLNSFALCQVLENLPKETNNKQETHTTDISDQKIMNIPINVFLPTVTLVPITLVVLVFTCNVKSWIKENMGDEKYDLECGLPSITYKELFSATIGFNKRMLLGEGGFGRVYNKGVLVISKQNAAIKRVSPESKQGMREFKAEITILGHLRHCNLVQMIGYYHHRQELLLVYEYMPNGSLDMHLYNRDKPTLGWAQRLCIIKGVASGLLYLHENWEQVVIHRDIKTSNVLLDDEMNGRLGDFGLARLHSHESDAHITSVAGTWGYIAPELARLRKATKATDVYAFAILIMEVVCGKRPIEVKADGTTSLLADSVLNAWQSGSIVDVVDTRLEEQYVTEEVELVLKLGLICSHPSPKRRPSMRQVMQYLEKDAPLPDFLPSFLTVDASKDDGIVEQDVPYHSVTTSITGLYEGT